MTSRPDAVVLTIDDEESVLFSLRNFLEDCNFKVLEATDGRVGLEIFEREKPDIVLVDLRMPEVDGLDVLGRISQSSPETPVLVVSGTGNISDVVEALRLGAWDYLLKPISDLSVLEHAVNKALERARLLKENRAYQENLEGKIKEYRDSLKESRAQVAMAEENERRRIAQGLHDGVAQDLAALAIQMQFIRDEIVDGENVEKMNEAIDIVQKCIDEIKSLTFALSPTILFELGYAAAVEWLVDDFKGRFPAKFEFNCHGYPKSLTDNKASLLYRSVRELLVNAVKHSQAENVWIDIARESGNVITCVEDDGIGFEGTGAATQKGRVGGYGLFSISQQMEHVGGEMKVQSGLNSGTKVLLTVPEGD